MVEELLQYRSNDHLKFICSSAAGIPGGELKRISLHRGRKVAVELLEWQPTYDTKFHMHPRTAAFRVLHGALYEVSARVRFEDNAVNLHHRVFNIHEENAVASIGCGFAHAITAYEHTLSLHVSMLLEDE